MSDDEQVLEDDEQDEPVVSGHYNDDDRVGKLNRAFRHMLSYRTTLFHATVRLGYPRFVDELLDTAGVGQTPDGRIVYYWNRAFFDSLSSRDVTYVAAHEALHLILGHPLRRKDRDPERWNIACDIAVNTLLDFQFWLRSGKPLDSRIQATQFGFDKYKVRDLTTEEIYDALPPNARLVGNIDDHGRWSELTEEQIKGIQRSISDNSKQWGSGSKGELAELAKIVAKPFPWQKFLRNRLASVRKPRENESWVRCHRKIYRDYPRVLLPGIHEGDANTSSILIAIDTSGSMSKESIEDLVAIVKSLPKEDYAVNVTWFDTEVYSARDLSMALGRGGTSFQNIEEVCRGQKPIKDGGEGGTTLSRYPDVVIPMTDGWAATPTLLYPKRWTWLLASHGSDYAVKDLGSTVWEI